MVIEIIVEDKLIISTRKIQKLNKVAYQTIKDLFTYKNPKFIENQKWGYSNHDTPKSIYCYEVLDGNILISRGGKEKLEKQLKKFGIVPRYIDRTLVCETVSFEQSNTILRLDQESFVSDLMQFDDGSGIAYTSFGKTLSLLELARRIGQPTLVLVHTTFLQEQWIKEATDPKTFNLDKKHIGGVGGMFAGKKRGYQKLNICLYQSMCKKEHLDFFKDRIGLVLFDEGQKSPIDGVQKVINNFRARYRYTASAALKRKDGKEFVTFDTFGPVRHVAIETASDSKILSQINLVPSPYQDLEDDGQYTNMITRMASDKDRNVLICKRALAKIKEGKLVLIFVERKFQAAIIAKYLGKYRVDMLLGPTNWKDYSLPHLKEKFKQTTDSNKRKAIVSKLDQAQKLSPKMLEIIKDYDAKTAYDRIEKVAMVKELDVIIGTQKAEVGLSIRTIDHIIVTTPAGNNAERFKQIIGRGERTYKQKEIDYFGCEKERPTVDVIVDAGVPSSRNAKDNIKEIYGKRVKTIRRRRK